MTARLGRIADIAREAAFLAGGAAVQAAHVKMAVKRTKDRASLPARKFQEMVERGTIIVKTSGTQVGQINGLAVMRSVPLTYGFPARITATISPDAAGLFNIEGFFDACNHFGLTGDQGVIIPGTNAGDLMLREDVVQQCMAGKFSVWPVDRIEQAVELMTGVHGGQRDDAGYYPRDTVLNFAVEKAKEFWRMSLSSPAKLAELVDMDSAQPRARLIAGKATALDKNR